jgi:predicted phosphodiesterase
MLLGIISDIHSNLEALQVVLGQLGQMEKIICLGDIVGYGPNPNECTEIIQEKNIISIAGNHDKAAVGELDTRWFNDQAKKAIAWTSTQLTPSNQQYLKELPLTLEFTDFQIVHGGLGNPLEEYISNLSEALGTFALMEKQLCFVGHSHNPLIVAEQMDGQYTCCDLADKQVVFTDDYKKIIINVGGVGQPRDGDPRASFGVYDSEKKEFTLQRIAYDIETVQAKMETVGLPENLITRLSYGK